MTCREAVERLLEFIDGELSSSEKKDLRTHLQDCRDCCQHAEFERMVKELVRRKCAEKKVPKGLEERIKKVVSEF